MDNPRHILAIAYARATSDLNTSIISDNSIVQNVELVVRQARNRAAVRVLLSSTLAKTYNPNIDIRHPYTAIKSGSEYSGRGYDEQYIADFINQHNLPANDTTAYLTPAFRNFNAPLTKDVKLGGNRSRPYIPMLQLLDDVYTETISASDLLAELIRQLAWCMTDMCSNYHNSTRLASQGKRKPGK